VELSPVQVSLFDVKRQQAAGVPGGNSQEMLNDAGEEEDFISFVEDGPAADNENVVKEWKF